MKQRFVGYLKQLEDVRRFHLVTNMLLSPIIKITKPQFESDDFWSVFVFNKEKLCENETLSNIEYLSDVAPDNLSAGVEFVLYEGKKVVANGIVLREIGYR